MEYEEGLKISIENLTDNIISINEAKKQKNLEKCIESYCSLSEDFNENYEKKYKNDFSL